ncbi:MAG TPA: TonB-dependent receptor [Steroidobacteraceae bacterium]|nr:TonB-dependent receptor [Steroidobacteraceae bacterium]
MAGIIRFTSASLAALAISAISNSQTAHAQTANPQQASAGSEEVETVVVTGVREALAKGLENKKENTQVIESIVAEDIGKLPDNNVVEALQRVTGVQITNRGGGEADGIVIRGLPDITTTWNGRNVFTGVGRSLALQDIPANLISQIDVFKTRASDQIETGLAGQIDVRTRRPFDHDGLQMSFNARAIQQEQRGETDPNLSFLVSNTWDGEDGRFGALINVSFGQTRYRDQSITAGALVPFAATSNAPLGYGNAGDDCPNTPPNNPNWIPLERIFNNDCRGTPFDPPGAPDMPTIELWEAGTDRGLDTAPGSTLNIAGVNYPYLLARDALFASDFEADRKRPAANVALQFAPNDKSEYTFEAFYQGYREEMFNNLHFTFADWWGSLGPNPASTITMYEGTNLIKTRTVGFPFGFNSGDSTKQDTDTFVYALNGKWQLTDRFKLEADLSVQGSQFESHFIAVRTERVPASITLDFNSGNGIPSWHFNDDEEMLDATRWNMGQLFQNAGKDLGRAQTLTVDGDYEFDEGNAFQRLSFGVRYDDRNALHRQPVTTPSPFLPAPRTLAQMPEGMLWNNDDFFDGKGYIPGSWLVANGYWIQDNADEVRALYGQPAGGPAIVRSYEVEERTGSVYLQTDFKLGDKFYGNAGLRYVKVSTPIEFNNLVLPDRPETRALTDVDDVMPSVTLRYEITDQFRLRANYGETLRRPGFGDLNPNFTLTEDLTGVGYGSGTGGNPDLVAAKGKNYDFTVEYYFSDDTAIFGTWFKREIDGLVVPFVQDLVIPGTGLNVDRFKVTRPVNASDGKLDGFEVGFLYFPDNLPNVLNGLGLQGSFTKLDSSQNIPRFDDQGTVVGEDITEFFGVSDTSYNLTLAYDRAGIGARLSYVWRDDFLNNNEARLFANPIGIWRQPEKSLDFQLNYDFNENFAVSFDAVNLTQEIQKSYYAFADSGGPDMFNFGNTLISRSFALGVRWKY